MVTESRIGILKDKEMLNVDTTVQSLSKGFLLPFRTVAMIRMTFQEQQRGSAEESKAREDAILLPDCINSRSHRGGNFRCELKTAKRGGILEKKNPYVSLEDQRTGEERMHCFCVF